MPTLLHEQQGLKIVDNDKNKFTVVTLHYTADPAKRSEAWREEAAAGMHPSKFAQEYELDYTAMFGAKVFPEITAGRLNIVVPAPYPEFPDTQLYWGGLDYGARNPSSFHVYTLSDGVIYSVWELYEPCRSIPEFVDKMQKFPQWDNIRYIAADPSIWFKNQQTKLGNLTSIYQLFVENKLHKLVVGITDEAAWLATMREHWLDAANPTFRIFDCCSNQIREFESAVYVTSADRGLQTQNYREAVADKNNHSLDDCKYFMNSRPKFTKKFSQPVDFIKHWKN